MVKPTVDISSGNETLDAILGGGLTANRIYLLDGHPGAGKTTLGLQFLLEGVRLGEKGLYVSLSETKDELYGIAESHGWDLSEIDIYELVDTTNSLDAESQYTIFQPSEVELGETTRRMLERVEAQNPRRVVIDSLSELRLLAQNPLRYRRQILALKQFFVGRDCTAIFLDDKTSSDNDLQLQSLAHGVVSLDRNPSEFGDERRRLRIVKFRGRHFVSGWHDFDIERGGVQIYPRIEAAYHELSWAKKSRVLSGNESLDALLGEGVAPGTSTLMLGPAGVGKSSCSTLFAVTACKRGERAVIFVFDESKETLRMRSAGLGMDLEEFEKSGLLEIHSVNPGDVSPGRFAYLVRQAVQPREDGARVSVVVIDSLNGYLSAMPEERFLQIQMHELLHYLGSCGISTFLIVAQHGMLGASMKTPVDASYLADTVILFRYFEAAGEIRQAISVVKKRDGTHERSIRELHMGDGKIRVGEPLRAFHGVLAGTPTYKGDINELIDRGSATRGSNV
ncbi:ATPase domain-containing protein [Botrimarina mediterranea]|uniref:non-specific serine/threonine protein kinase n=1 Tax=Botrimarina mediterranea TaxID=2528022 RepID=A0A518K540_9BACT|nr:ATPase domain-containing protein [Botrimarina mediterranea]QDV72913.1 Circadian clock protein kinase KaiC [Botrimarina mediterranea]QDV77486.1 Circadian clock protein kinase KaiC [Planctomycetes bacterium K2D]